jgi:hypothetical protein
VIVVHDQMKNRGDDLVSEKDGAGLSMVLNNMIRAC